MGIIMFMTSLMFVLKIVGLANIGWWLVFSPLLVWGGVVLVCALITIIIWGLRK